jgi:hypothetical protein
MIGAAGVQAVNIESMNETIIRILAIFFMVLLICPF